MLSRIIKLMDDGINKKNVTFPIETLEEMLTQTYKSGTPSCVSHDYSRSFAWTKPKGLLLDPVSCSLVGEFSVPSNNEDWRYLAELTSDYITEKHFQISESLQEELKRSIKTEITRDAKFINFGFIGVIDKDIVRKIFPEIFEGCDRDCLIDYSMLKALAPGVFEKGNLIFFSHQYFRRSFSRLNNINDSFFYCLDKIQSEQCSIKIAIDTDMIGLKSTFQIPLEFEYWWGPKFNDSLKEIPLGVTCYKADERLKVFHQIDRTEFFWYIQDNNRTFECEEISDSDVKNSDFNFGCRYIHSMLENTSEKIIHLDGAVRGYTDEQMVKRLDIDISKQEKNLLYTKLWRIDGDISKRNWKELICHYFRDNYLPGEYFKPEKDSNTQEYLSMAKAIDNNYFEEDYFDINQDNGIYVYVEYSQKEKFAMFSADFNLATCDFLQIYDTGSYYVDCSYIELQKLLERKGIVVNSTFSYKNIAFEDLVSNLPLIFHSGINSVQNANITFDTIKELISLYHKNCQERILSFVIGVQYDDKVVVYSMLGNIVDMDNLLQKNISIPKSMKDIPCFLKNIKELNKKSSNRLPLSNIRFTNGIYFKRELIFTDQFSCSCNEHSVYIEFKNHHIKAYMEKHGLKPAMVNIINSSECQNCGKEYKNCDCLKYENSVEKVIDMDFIACVLTRHKA